MRDTNNEYVKILWEIADLEDAIQNKTIPEDEREDAKKRLKDLQSAKALIKRK